jgi:YVTN family beta-propeller protein
MQSLRTSHVPALGCLVAVILGASCNTSTTSTAAPSRCPSALAAIPQGVADVPRAETATPTHASFTVTIDPSDASLRTAQREPLAQPITVIKTTGSLELRAGVKKFAKYNDRLFLELYVSSVDDEGVLGARATVRDIKGAAAFYDFSVDPWAAPTSTTTIPMGGVAPRGVARLKVGFDLAPSGGPISFAIDIDGTRTTRASTTSSPIVASPDGAEVWAVQSDADVVSILDTASDARVAQVRTPGKPSSVALTPDGALALVACSSCNQVTVIDRKKRTVVQVIGEAEGIGRDPKNVVVAPDGSRAYVSSYVGDTVTALERVGAAFRVVKSIPVGRRPVGMSVTPDGATLFVAHYLPRGKIADNGAWVSIVATDSLAEVAQAELRDDGNTKEAACLAQVTAFQGYPAEKLSFEASPTQLAGVFLTPSGDVGWVPGLRVAGFPILEGDVSQLGFQFAALGANSPAMLFPLDTRDARHAGFRRVSGVVDITDRDEGFLRCTPALDDTEAVRAEPGATKDELQFAGVTIPSQATLLGDTGVSRFVGYTLGGRRALVLSYVADEIAVFDAATHSPTSLRNFLLSGSNPIGIAVTPDGRKGYVAYENSTFASVLDLSAYATSPLPLPTIVPYRLDAGAPAGQGAAIITFQMLTRTVRGIPDAPSIRELTQVPLVDADAMDPLMRRGRVLFSSSNPIKYPTLTGSRQASCASCHPNGGNDGTAWSTMEGERRTIGLWGGLAGRGWLHASATHRSGIDFATTIVKERLGGTGLSDPDVNALSEYLARGIPTVQRPRVDSGLAARGAAIFARSCASCHAGADYGDGRVDPADRFGGGEGDAPPLHDVGTATDWASVTLSDAYTHLFPPTAKRVLDALRGDRDLGPNDYVQTTLKFTPRPERKRGFFKASSLVNTYENVVHFHDGRFTELSEVVDYFDALLSLGLSTDDRVALVEYLKTL